MDKTKLIINTKLKNKISQYGPYILVIYASWDKQFHS
ncbi:hypothetical protein NC653_031862 [Populus alba x Populus x berolinensis]|uniref:Uncharacterized protein n=1 Tax=Populus alba x Populus x berolinensis TaxID=444605 RepID=A0AAD6LVS4_9ROSI|nr:hypothetical protein NC653_030094 [Populus alba x Populus x berolinensis]KAJ6975149.1 hypothetical protein NC653_031100 [Populus alba x Populus x berolinensis]KAJ6976158.1 hypothetical protein NC653_031862 [Populus alba x Populus x berolinensis]